MDRMQRRIRAVSSQFETREDGQNPCIEGYFAVFNSNYEIGSGLSESIAPGAFTNTLNRETDVRALIDHETRLVLGRTKSKTLTLKEDSKGLWGHIDINPNDVDAMNLYERVKRGDVDQCSFGFGIVNEETEVREDDSIHWTIKEVELYEVTVCTFPAYEETSVDARKQDIDNIKKRALDKWRLDMRKKLKVDQQGGD